MEEVANDRGTKNMLAFRPKLAEIKIIRYSPSEKKIFDLIPRTGKKINMTDLTNKFYNGELRPGAQNAVSVMLRSLIKKMNYNKEQFEIKRSGRAGPNSMEVWFAPRRRRVSNKG
jgi:hypothetical protein